MSVGKFMAWFVGLLIFGFIANSILNRVPKNDPKSLLEKAAKDCFVEKAQNRMSDAPCRAMENSARNL